MTAPSFTPDRLILRPFQREDAPRVRALASDYEVAKYCINLPHPYPAEAAEQWIASHEVLRSSGSGYPFAIVASEGVVGCISIKHNADTEFELAYWLGRPFWNKGLATEAAAAMLDFAFDRRALRYLRARFISDNAASARVLAKTGFLATGRTRIFNTLLAKEVEMTHVVVTRDARPSKQVYKAA